MRRRLIVGMCMCVGACCATGASASAAVVGPITAVTVAATQGGGAVVVWQGAAEDGHKIMAAERDGPGAFTGPQVLSRPGNPAGPFSGASDARGDAIVTWENVERVDHGHGDVQDESRGVFAASRVSGGAFSSRITLSEAPRSALALPQAALASSGIGQVFWFANGGPEIATWTPAGGFSVAQSLGCLYCSSNFFGIDSAGSATYPGYRPDLGGDVTVQRSSDGKTSQPARLPSAAGTDHTPHIVVADDGAAIAYWTERADGQSPGEVRFSLRSAGSATFGSAQTLSAASGSLVAARFDTADRAVLVGTTAPDQNAITTVAPDGSASVRTVALADVAASAISPSGDVAFVSDQPATTFGNTGALRLAVVAHDANEPTVVVLADPAESNVVPSVSISSDGLVDVAWLDFADNQQRMLLQAFHLDGTPADQPTVVYETPAHAVGLPPSKGRVTIGRISRRLRVPASGRIQVPLRCILRGTLAGSICNATVWLATPSGGVVSNRARVRSEAEGQTRVRLKLTRRELRTLRRRGTLTAVVRVTGGPRATIQLVRAL